MAFFMVTCGCFEPRVGAQAGLTKNDTRSRMEAPLQLTKVLLLALPFLLHYRI